MAAREAKGINDLCVNRGAIVKINQPKSQDSNVLEITMSLCVVPREQYEQCEYEAQVKKITTYISKSLRGYVIDNNMFHNKSIVDVNFTSANLRAGYHKNVQVSMFVMLKNKLKHDRLVKRVKETIKPTIKSITDRFSVEGYICHKRKKQINKSIKVTRNGNDIS